MVLEPREVLAPELSVFFRTLVLVPVGIVSLGGGTNLAPMWPLDMLVAKSMCILVTSGGRMAAPGPQRRLINCWFLLGVRRGRGWTGAAYPLFVVSFLD